MGDKVPLEIRQQSMWIVPLAYFSQNVANEDVLKAFMHSFQKVSKVSVTPFDFSMNLQTLTVEKLSFSLPRIFTIGPVDNSESLNKYAILLLEEPKVGPCDRLLNIIQGEALGILSKMSTEELFRERKFFQNTLP